MMKQEDWTGQLRKKLAGHQASVPEDLWADVEAGIDGRKGHRGASSWRRWIAAAAVVLLLAGGSLVLYERGEKQETGVGMHEARRDRQEASTPEQETTAAEELTIEERETPKLVAQKVQRPEPVTVMPETQVNEQQTTEKQTTETLTDNGQMSDTLATDHIMTTERAVAESVYHSQDLFLPVGNKQHDKQQLVAALYAGNSFENRYNTEHVQMSGEMAQMYYAMNDVSGARRDSPIWLADYEEREHHERPFSVGLQLRYPFTDRLTVNTGVIYTRLKSEFTTLMKGREVEQQQQLHYVGLPLALQYRLLQFGHLNIYASAGGQVDWNVSARMSINGMKTDIDRDRCQWSLYGSLGLSYDLTSHIALFAEPGVRHYLDNHSGMRNYFKEKPTDFSLQVGLQLTIDH